MQNLIPTGNTLTMTSLELVDFINAYRKKQADIAGADFPSKDFAKVEHGDFLKKVSKVLKVKDLVAGNFSSYYIAANGKANPMYVFPKRESCLMAMSYSYELQAAVFDHMTALEAKLSQPVALPSYAETLRLYADQIEATQRLTAERDEAIATKALIGSKREATAMATASAAKRKVRALQDQLGVNQRHATVIAVERATGRSLARNTYVELRRWCKAHDQNPVEVVDARYGTVKAWPAGAWLAVHGIDLSVLFSSAEEAA